MAERQTVVIARDLMVAEFGYEAALLVYADEVGLLDDDLALYGRVFVMRDEDGVCSRVDPETVLPA